jgi:hypothetical protein
MEEQNKIYRRWPFIENVKRTLIEFCELFGVKPDIVENEDWELLRNVVRIRSSKIF